MSIRIYLIISLYNIALNNDYTEDENINCFNPKKIIQYYQEVNTKIKKSLGQKFLLDQNISRKIISNLTQNGNNEEILEVGPGLGNLTVMLCKNQSIEKIILVEKDKDFEKAVCKWKLKFPQKNTCIFYRVHAFWSEYI